MTQNKIKDVPDKMPKVDTQEIGEKAKRIPKPKAQATEQISFEEVLIAAVKVPGVRIDRNKYLTDQLTKKYGADITKKAIETSPALAGIPLDDLGEMAEKSIKFETGKTTALAVGTGMPGGLAMAATIPVDLAQNLAHMLRIMQKLLYLYGWKDLFEDENNIDDETASIIIVFVGIMAGVDGAAALVGKIAGSAGMALEKHLMSQALTKSVVYPLVKKISKILGIKMTKQVFAKGAGKAVPIIGGVINGGLTLASFAPMTKKLKLQLEDLQGQSLDHLNEKGIGEYKVKRGKAAFILNNEKYNEYKQQVSEMASDVIQITVDDIEIKDVDIDDGIETEIRIDSEDSKDTVK